MFQSLIRKIALRSALLVLLIHAGTALSLLGLASLPRTDTTTTAWNLLASGVGVLYGAFLISTFWVAWPLFTLTRRVRQLLRWKVWLLEELPRIIAMIPQIVQAFREAFPQKSEGTAAAATPRSSNPPPSA